MYARLTIACIALIACFGANMSVPVNDKPDQPKLWALLVAGSNGWWNYRHQADVCHAYQILHAHGIPDENIVVMMYDDIAQNEENPTKGIIINRPGGEDVYHDVPKDYVGDDVTPENFLNILTGNKEAMKGIGSGKVIASGPNDHVFVNFVDHGAEGIVAFPDGELTAKALNEAIQKMYKEKRYGKMVLYIEACEAGSMFRGILPNNTNVFATTASNYNESSWGWYCDEGTCLGDLYSINWMEDSDKEDIEKESLADQFEIVRNLTTKSHVMEYGDLTISKLVVGQFQGEKNAPSKTLPEVSVEHGVPSPEIPLHVLYKKMSVAKTTQQKEQIQSQIDDLLEKRAHLDTMVKKIVARLSSSLNHHNHLLSAKPENPIKLDCHHKLVKAFSRHCFNFGKNAYALRYVSILANICEDGLDANEAIRVMEQVCKAANVKEGIN